MTRSTVIRAFLLAGVSQLLIGVAAATPVTWTDWTSIGSTSASGSMGGITVSVTATAAMDGVSQTDCGTNYWTEPNPAKPAYTGGSVSNAPTACEQVGLNSANSITVSFSSPISGLYMALLSVGQLGFTVTYDFDTAFAIDSSGQGFWGDGTFVALPGDALAMQEFHGVLLFSGPVSSLTFSTAPAEFWHAFTFGVGAVPEPGSLVLLALGLAGLAFTRRRTH